MEKIYVGNGKVINGKFGQFTKANFSRKNLETMLEYMDKNQTNYININLENRKEPDKYGNTLSCVIDTFKPDKDKVPF